jgi:predicted transcriptional regulator
MEKAKIIIINPLEDMDKLKALASEQRIQLLNLLRREIMNINEMAEFLRLPQSNVATNIGILEDAGLVLAEKISAKRGNQKRCSIAFSEIVVEFPKEKNEQKDVIEVEMPIGLFTNYSSVSPCGLCSTENIIGYLDTPESFLEPDRVKAGLLWTGSGFVEYKFPNNLKYESRNIQKLEVSLELSSEIPGTNKEWLSDITMWINNIEIGAWTSPGDFGDRRGALTPSWWKLEGSQYGLLKQWFVTAEGSFIDGNKISGICLTDLTLEAHSSIKVRIGVKENAQHLGGMNIFGRGFGNYNQGIILRLYF